MSKVFQIIDGFVHWQTPFSKLIDVGSKRYPPEVMAQLVETDNELVREGWGYVDGDFVRPTAPEGWLYDNETGTFYKDGEIKPSQKTPEARILQLEADKVALASENKALSAKVAAQSQSLQMQEDCLVEMAGVVYA